MPKPKQQTVFDLFCLTELDVRKDQTGEVSVLISGLLLNCEVVNCQFMLVLVSPFCMLQLSYLNTRNDAVVDVSIVGEQNALMFRGRSVDKGRVAICAPISLGFQPYTWQGYTFCCGFLCGIQFAVSVTFLWLIFQ